MQVSELPHEKSWKPSGQVSPSVSLVVVVVVVVVVVRLVVGCLRGRVVVRSMPIHTLPSSPSVSRRFRRFAPI